MPSPIDPKARTDDGPAMGTDLPTREPDRSWWGPEVGARRRPRRHKEIDWATGIIVAAIGGIWGYVVIVAPLLPPRFDWIPRSIVAAIFGVPGIFVFVDALRPGNPKRWRALLLGIALLAFAAAMFFGGHLCRSDTPACDAIGGD